MPKVSRICKNCEKEFKIDRWRLNDKKKRRGLFCSRKCKSDFHSGKNHWAFGKKRPEISGVESSTWTGGKPRCIDCNKKLVSYSAKRCRECNAIFNSGENHYLYGKKRPYMTKEKHPNWKGGITRKHSGTNKTERIRFRDEIQKLVLERDNYTCQICGERGGKLQVDHIQSWAEYVDLRFDINNCRTLCMSCHYKITFGREMPENITTWGHNLSKRGG